MCVSRVSDRYMEGLACSFWGTNSENSPGVGHYYEKYERIFLMQYEHRCKNSTIQINHLISELLTDIFSVAFLRTLSRLPLSKQRFSFVIRLFRLKISYSYNKNNALISQIYFWNKTLHVSDSSSVHHQGVFNCTHSNGIYHTGLLAYTIAVCTVKKNPR